ncbi:hypothetical protein AK812_SmicGene32558 [Symbiodinium microadriaticum]|uniref:Uncharacterized protein n=1 Tax=Symbiodinium microadriaticum TaxID=2951 RepID=A0A1Q9CU07_SYMMI|nr:hypothetical protein AK812_SmicGene32558 [Symbiodinium microadriaticum]
MAKPTGHTWIRVSDPSCPVIKMTRAAQSSLAWLAPRIAAIPTTPLSLPPILSSLARADAMAEGNQVGIGGWVSTKQGLAWFAEAYTMEEIRSFWPFLTKDAQKYIACFETLAQLALAMTAKAHHGHTRLSLCLPTESDNTPTEGGVNKLFTTSWPLSEFLSLIASWSSANGISVQVSHVAGAHNEWADDLSRGRLQAFAHRGRDRFRVSLDMLSSASAQASWSSKDRTPPAVGESYMYDYAYSPRLGKLPGATAYAHARKAEPPTSYFGQHLPRSNRLLRRPWYKSTSFRHLVMARSVLLPVALLSLAVAAAWRSLSQQCFVQAPARTVEGVQSLRVLETTALSTGLSMAGSLPAFATWGEGSEAGQNIDPDSTEAYNRKGCATGAVQLLPSSNLSVVV